MSDEAGKPSVTVTQAKRLAELAEAQTTAAHLAAHLEELKKRPPTGTTGALTPSALKKWLVALGVVVVPLCAAISYMYGANLASHEAVIEQIRADVAERVTEIKQLCGLGE
jgi:hypothetical protein